MNSENHQECEIRVLCETLTELKKLWITSEDEFIHLTDGYYLKTSAVPIACIFWKQLIENRWLHRNKKISRFSLEKEYKQEKHSERFAHVLFALSWLGLVKVLNSTTVIIVNQPHICF
jgi:hypothetical protein